MPAAITDIGAGAHGSLRRRCATRWWLAGLLVSCLLPAGLAHSELLRPIERAAQVSILVPALLRVRCRLQARRHALVRWVRRAACWPRKRARAVAGPILAACRAVAAHDVLTRRGPPCLR